MFFLPVLFAGIGYVSKISQMLNKSDFWVKLMKCHYLYFIFPTQLRAFLAVSTLSGPVIILKTKMPFCGCRPSGCWHYNSRVPNKWRLN